MAVNQVPEIRELLEDRLKEEFAKFRTQGIMIGWLAAYQAILEHIKTLRYKRDIENYLKDEIKRIQDNIGATK